jgi:hypothetical protein
MKTPSTLQAALYLDLELNCPDRFRPGDPDPEIIEIAVVELEVASLRIVREVCVHTVAGLEGHSTNSAIARGGVCAGSTLRFKNADDFSFQHGLKNRADHYLGVFSGRFIHARPILLPICDVLSPPGAS